MSLCYRPTLKNKCCRKALDLKLGFQGFWCLPTWNWEPHKVNRGYLIDCTQIFMDVKNPQGFSYERPRFNRVRLGESGAGLGIYILISTPRKSVTEHFRLHSKKRKSCPAFCFKKYELCSRKYNDALSCQYFLYYKPTKCKYVFNNLFEIRPLMHNEAHTYKNNCIFHNKKSNLVRRFAS